MRPDVEDYAEIDENQQTGGSRAMSWLVLAVAVGGFAALAYYAYNSGTQPAAEGETLTVEADATPIKEAPTDAEGEQFANKDKTIYEAISPEGEKSVEKLLPDAERPNAAMNVEDSEDSAPVATASPSTLAAVANNVVPAPAPVVAAPAPVVAAAPAPASTAPTTYVAAEPVAAAPVAKPEKSYAAPEMINEKKAAEPKVEAKAEPKKVEVKKAEPKKEVAKPATTAKVASGSATVQLGAFKSEAEAQTAWKKISGANADVLKGAPTIVKADVNGSTFYRLRAGVSDAKAACAKLSAKGQACMAVK